MARIAYILLCHRNPDAIVRQAKLLTSQGDSLAIHVDARAGKGVFDAIQTGLRGNTNVVFAKRVKCGWGEWSLVQATLNAVKAATQAFAFTTHYYLLSGDCMPIKPAFHIHQYLDDNDADFIENRDFFTSYWIKTGIRAERLTYRHWFNERSHQWAFYASLKVQQTLRLSRQPPKGLQIMIGSQWWCLRRGTVEKILKFIRMRRDIVRFFRTTWIPDETFFQTLVYHLVPRTEVQSRSLTFLTFSDYGMPVTFHADHFEFLRGQDNLFARKISVTAAGLHAKLAELFVLPNRIEETTNNGVAVFNFVTSQGRFGTRYAPRFWEQGRTLGAGRLLQVLVCKKWHVAQRLAGQIHDAGGPGNFGYVFDGDRPDLPAMGGFENSRAKRLQHRRAFLNVLAEHQKTDTLSICVDPSNLAALADLAGDESMMHVLEITCEIDEAYLVGHAERIGLSPSLMPTDARNALVANLRATVNSETAAIRKLNLPAMFRIKFSDDRTEIAEVLAGFSGIYPERARFIAEDAALFV